MLSSPAAGSLVRAVMNRGCLTPRSTLLTITQLPTQHRKPTKGLQFVRKAGQSSLFNTRKRKERSWDFESSQVTELKIEKQESLWPALEILQTPWALLLKPGLGLSGLFLVCHEHCFLDLWSKFEPPYEVFISKSFKKKNKKERQPKCGAKIYRIRAYCFSSKWAHRQTQAHWALLWLSFLWLSFLQSGNPLETSHALGPEVPSSSLAPLLNGAGNPNRHGR